MAQAKRDGNRVSTLLGVSSADLVTPTLIKVNPVTGAVLADISGSGVGDVLGPSTNTDSYIPQWDGTDSKTLKDGIPLDTVLYRRPATKVVAASDSLDITHADYVCDGTDDDVQIQAAIDALPTTGGRVVLMEGNFLIGAAITIAKNGVTLEGQGDGTIVKIGDAENKDVIIVGDGSNPFSNINIRNLKIDGNYSNQTTGTIHGVKVNNLSTFVSIEKCFITACRSSSVSYGATAHDGRIVNNILSSNDPSQSKDLLSVSSARATISGNKITGADNCGIYIVSTNSVVSNNIITNSVKGIEVGGTGNKITLSSNTIVNCSTPISIIGTSVNISQNYIAVDGNITTAAIYLEAGDNIVNGNSVVDLGNVTNVIVGIDVWGNRNIISNNRFYFDSNYAHKGIVGHTPSYIDIVGNVFYSNDWGTVSGSVGISAINGGGSNISNNLIYDFETAISVTSSQNRCSENIIYSCDIGIASQASNTVISGNDLYGKGSAAGDGISSTGSNCSIVGNNIYYFGYNGIKVDGGDKNSISSNVITNCGGTTDNTYSGILITGTSTYNVITGNNITGSQANNPKYGISEATSNDGPNIITSNICLDAQTSQISALHASTDVSHNITT